MDYSIKGLRYHWGTLEESRRVEKGESVLRDSSQIVRYKTDFIVVNNHPSVTEVVVTGSTEPREWISNILAWNRKGFHNGFYRAADGMREQLRRWFWSNSIPIEVKCHSRGIYGLILAYMMKCEEDLWPNVSVVSFGAPEPCKRKGLDLLIDSDIPHQRVVTKADFVQHLGLGRHYETGLTLCPNVPDALDHTNYGKALNIFESEMRVL